MTNSYKEKEGEELVYSYVEDPDHFIDSLIKSTVNEEEIEKLEAIKLWPEYAKTKWLLSNDEQPTVGPMGAAGCAAMVVVLIATWVLVDYWETTKDKDGNTVRKKMQERRKQIEEVQKLVHQQSHKNGKCPDDG